MAQDIVPIEMGLPQGDVVTLWAPRWREDDEEWEAFLGHEESLYGFPDVAHMAGFVRTVKEHDLADHPAWHVMHALSAMEFSPDEDHQYDLVGVPELVAETPDTWTINELADIVTIIRSLADVCELTEVHEILDSAVGFSLLHQGTFAFTGRDGQKRWKALCEVVVDRWDTVLDAVDGVVTAPDVSQDAVSNAETELAEAWETENDDEAPATTEASDVDAEDVSNGFWDEIGIDPIKIITSAGEYYSLRCYLDDDPLFLGTDGTIHVFTSPRALLGHLTSEQVREDNDLARVVTFPSVLDKANAGELDVTVTSDNTYVLTGLEADIAEGPSTVDAEQLDLVEELLGDAALWAGDGSVDEALKQSERLGWFVSYVLNPSNKRLPPSGPFDEEARTWQQLAQSFENRLQVL